MNFDALKTKIADSAARSDIECNCERALSGDVWWYDLSSAGPEDQEWVDDAVAYLTARGLLEVKGDMARFVRKGGNHDE
ncbi:MAG TPA: hypothetical protein ENK29_04160 [Chromatiales bacterium]|nr:hypothetical protein [Chromatiales bacterium]